MGKAEPEVYDLKIPKNIVTYKLTILESEIEWVQQLQLLALLFKSYSRKVEPGLKKT
ncbi:MAG: hypothetical protein QW374_03290 [Candidatus Bathyarchaeia archaeon]|nr:hypothetical protein [Candidatus Bathyarchaeota archaeon]